MKKRQATILQMLLLAGVFCCLISLSVAEERTLTPEQQKALADGGEIPIPEDPNRPAKLPDLTKNEHLGEKKKSDLWSLGPTGVIGYMVGGFRGDQIQVDNVLPGSPAEGLLQWGDVLLGINGKKFIAGEHLGITIGNAIIEAEKEENQGLLKLQVWRDRNYVKRNGAKDVTSVDIEKLFAKAQGDNSTYEWKLESERKKDVQNIHLGEFPIDGTYTNVELKLRVMPSYSDTSPYHCPKATQIREDAWKVLEKRFLVDPERRGSGRGGMLEAIALVASGKPEHRKLVREWVRSDHCKAWHPKDEGEISLGKGYGYASWHMGFSGLNCAIYYDATGDDFVLPALREYAIKTAMGQSGGGCWGHTFAWPSFNGGQLHGMNPGYGALNAAGNRCFFLVALAKELGVKHPEIDAALIRAHRFFGSYVDKGAIPYGFHPAAATDDSNGKNTGVAFAMKILGDHHGAKYFAQMSTHASFTRRAGHGNDYFWHWSPWAATLCGPQATIVTMRNMRWWHTLCRRHDGGFVIHSPTGAKTLRDPTATYVLHYSAPLKQTIITGKAPVKSLWITQRDKHQLLTSALPQLNDPSLIERSGTPWPERTTDELLELLDIFKPKARGQIASELGKRYQAGEKDILLRLVEMLESERPRYRGGACRGLAACGTDATLQYLSKVARLLKDPAEFVRMQAVQTISKASNSQDTQLALLKATVDDYQPMSMPPNNVRAWTQSPLFRVQSELADSPFEAGFDEELVQAALECLIELDPMGQRGFLQSRLNIWSKDTVIRLAGPLTFVAEDKQLNDQMFGGSRHMASRALLGRFGYREYIEASAGPLRKNAALPRDIRPKVTFKLEMVDPEVIKKHPAACHELLEPLKLWLMDSPLARVATRKGERIVYTNVDDLIQIIEAATESTQLPSIASDVEKMFQAKLSTAGSTAEMLALCRKELKDTSRKTCFRQMAAMNQVVKTLGPNAMEDLVPYIGHEYWRLRQHARTLALELVLSGGEERLLEQFAKTDGETAAGILAVLSESDSKAGLKTAQQALQHVDPVVRQAAVQAVVALGGDKVLPEVFAFMRQAKEPEDLRGCEQALLSRRDDAGHAQRVCTESIAMLSKSGPKLRYSLYWILSQFGGLKSMIALEKAAATDDDDEFNEIVKALSYSPDRAADKVLLSIIQENLDTPRATVASNESVRRMVIGSDDIGNLSDEQRLDFAEPLLKRVRNPSIIAYLGHVHSGRSARLLQNCMRLGGVTSTAAESIISATTGMENAPATERKAATAALVDTIEYIEVTHLRGGALANNPKSYAGWKALSSKAGKNLLKLDKPEQEPLPEFDDMDLDL